jgi:transposase-like protein
MMKIREKKLNSKQSKAIILLLEDKSIAEIAGILKVALNTLYKWLETNEVFIKAYAEAREKIFSEALEQLKEASREAVKTLREVMRPGYKESARVSASKTILELALKMKEINELEARIKALEEKLK